MVRTDIAPQTLIVRGQVRWSDGKPFTAATIQALDRDLRGEQALGQTKTDVDGIYQIPYTAAQFSRAEKASADCFPDLVCQP